jgi:hypothetical protein
VPSTGVAQQAGDDLDLAGAEIGLAMGPEDVLDRHARGFLDLLVAVDELAAEPAGEAAANSGLAGSHHADKHDRPAGEQGCQPIPFLFAQCRGVACHFRPRKMEASP